MQTASGRRRCLSAEELHERLEEEVGRAIRHGTALSCLLVRLDDFDAIAAAHGETLAEQALLRCAQAMRAELRAFDRVGKPRSGALLVVLPGADATAGGTVARRSLKRLRAIKLESGQSRTGLSISIGIAAWEDGWGAERLIEESEAAAAIARRPTEG